MNRIIFPLALLLTFAFSSCGEAGKTESKQMTITESQESAPGFIHAVYFWLKKDNPQLLEEFKTKGLSNLATCPTIKHVHWGPPAGTPRSVVDNSYDMAWIVTFENAADQDAYQVEPIHKEFVSLYEGLFEKVQVYDSVITDSK